MADLSGGLLEDYIPVVKYSGIRTNKNMEFGTSATVTLPADTTIGGSAVVALGDITSSSTSATAFTVTNSGVFTGTGGVVAITANSATSPTSIFVITANGITSGGVGLITSTGTLVTTASLLTLTANSATTAAGILRINANGLTSGLAGAITSTGTIVTTGGLLNLTANTATTSTGILRVSATGLTEGFAVSITSGGANLTTGGAVNISNGASTAGVAVVVASTGVMTTTAGLLTLTGNSATTASGLLRVNGLGLTSGLVAQFNGTSATMTTGRYLSCNDATGEVFGVGANGHLHTVLGGATAPVMTTNSTGISATAIIAGSTDVNGGFTTTGTPESGTALTCTFHKTYTNAPKFVVITPVNAAAGNPNTVPYVSSITATTFVLTWPAGGTYAATPSYRYFVIA